MKSKIILNEVLPNSERKFGSFTDYFPVKIIDGNGIKSNAFFTKSQIDIATKRAQKNPEDIPKDKTLWSWLTG